MKRFLIAVLIVALISPIPWGDHVPLWVNLYMYMMIAFDLFYILDQRINAYL